MSQTETLMLVVLGFALALIVVLLFGRLIWNIAVRLGARRNQREMPAQILDLQAERDRLRAEQAMLSRKLELRLDDVKMRMAEQMAEVSRHRNRVETLLQEISRRNDTIAQKETEISGLREQLANADAALKDNAELIRRFSSEGNAKDAEIGKLTQDLANLSASLREKNSKIATLGTELESTVRLVSNIGSPGESTEDRIRRRIAELTSLSTQLSQAQETARNTISPLPAAGEGAVVKPADGASLVPVANQHALEEKLAETERETQALEEELKKLDEAWSEQLAGINPPAASEEIAREPEQKSGVNVVSLAQRIRALQRGVAE
jgi:chromosome segregation ATPase